MKILLALFLATVATAQTPATNDLAIGQKMKQNAEALRQYTYKRRTSIEAKGQPRGARLDLVRYVDGKMETVPLESPQRPEQSAGGRGLRGKIVQNKIEKKKEEMKEEREKLTALLHTYLSAGSFEKATISKVGDDVKVVAPNMTLIWSVANHRPVRMEIHAELEGKPVQMKVEFAALPDGSFYNAHTRISMPKKDLVINIDNFDYTKG